MTATANVLLKINTTADLAGVKAGLDMIGALAGKVVEAMKAVDAFGDAHSRLTQDVSKAVDAVRGLISAQDLYQASNRLSAAGINASASQLEGLAKKATEYAQATGQDIPTALNQMTQAVIAGSERGLRQFGVELDGSTDKLSNAHSALNQFSTQMESTKITVDSLSNTLDALGNNASDAAKRILELAGASSTLASPLSSLNDALSTFNSLMEVAPDKTAAFFNVLKGTGIEAIRGVLGALQSALTPLEMLADIFGSLYIQGAKLLKLGDINPVAALKRAIEALRGKLGEASGELARDLVGEATSGSLSGLQQAQSSAWQSATAGAAAAARRGAGRGGRGGGRGGGGGSGGGGAMEFDASEEAAREEILTRDLIGPARTSRYGIEDLTSSEAVDEMVRKAEYADGLQQKIADRVMQLQAMIRGVQEERALRNDPEVRAEMLRLEREETISFYEQSLNYAERFGEAWSASLKSVSAGGMTATSVQNGLRGAMTMVANAAVNGGKLTVSAVADMVKGVALALGIEATIKAAFELAEAIAEKASTFGIGGNTHLAAAAQYAITAALAYAVAGGAAGISSAAGGGGSSKMNASTGSIGYGSPGYSSYEGNKSQTNVTIEITGEAGDIFRVVKKENDRRSYSGEQSFRST